MGMFQDKKYPSLQNSDVNLGCFLFHFKEGLNLPSFLMNYASALAGITET